MSEVGPGCVKTRQLGFTPRYDSASAEGWMKRFVEGIDRGQATLFPECLADWIDENNPGQMIDVFVDELDLAALGFEGVAPRPEPGPQVIPAFLIKAASIEPLRPDALPSHSFLIFTLCSDENKGDFHGLVGLIPPCVPRSVLNDDVMGLE